MDKNVNEKVLVKGVFQKMNVPALICLALCFVSLVNYIDASNGRYPARDELTLFSIGTIIFAILSVIFFFWMSGCNVTVTDKRVYGTGAFRKRVDLPFDMISSVGGGILGSIAVATSSGKINFWFVKNKNEIFDAVTKCLIERQNKGNYATVNQVEPQNNADELKKFKDLLDAGVITQEEFDAKKKQILGL